MVRVEVEEHVAASGAVHMRKAVEKVAVQGNLIAVLQVTLKGEQKEVEVQRSLVVEQKEEIAGLTGELEELNSVIAGLQRFSPALMNVFTWDTGSEGSHGKSASHTFTAGVTGHCFSQPSDQLPRSQFMGFILKEGPVCGIHYK